MIPDTTPDWMLYLLIAGVSAGSFIVMFHLSAKLGVNA